MPRKLKPFPGSGESLPRWMPALGSLWLPLEAGRSSAQPLGSVWGSQRGNGSGKAFPGLALFTRERWEGGLEVAGLGARHPVYPPEIAALGRRGWAGGGRMRTALPACCHRPGGCQRLLPLRRAGGMPPRSQKFSFLGRDASVPRSAQAEHSSRGQKASGHRVAPRCHLRLSQHPRPTRNAHSASAFSILILFSPLRLIPMGK